MTCIRSANSASALSLAFSQASRSSCTSLIKTVWWGERGGEGGGGGMLRGGLGGFVERVSGKGGVRRCIGMVCHESVSLRSVDRESQQDMSCHNGMYH